MYKNYLKRTFDIVTALVLLPFFMVILIIVAPLIYLEDKGAVFYNAPRLGKGGRVFTMFKFRTMKMNAPDMRNPDNSTYSAKDDPRVTKSGKVLRKLSIDELPQLINVLKGDMSIIGPRPHLAGKSTSSFDKNRLKCITVRPGITGYNQAFFRNAVSKEEKIENDVYYVDHLSLGMDIKIIFKTFLTVIKAENIYSRSR